MRAFYLCAFRKTMCTATVERWHGRRRRTFHLCNLARYGVVGNLRCLVKVYRAVERYWHRMLRSRSWAGRALNWSMFNQINERTPLLRPKLRLRYPELQALAVL